MTDEPGNYRPRINDDVRIKGNALHWRVVGINAEDEAHLISGQSGRSRIEPITNLVPWRESQVRG